jgi:hypothetical protein
MRGRFAQTTKKPLEEPRADGRTVKAKARYFICDFTDPDLLELPRSVPVASTLTLHVLLQLWVQHDMNLSIGDVSTAYLDSLVEQRQSGDVYVTLKGVPGVEGTRVRQHPVHRGPYWHLEP